MNYSLRDIVCMELNIRAKKGHHIWGLHIHVFGQGAKIFDKCCLIIFHWQNDKRRERGKTHRVIKDHREEEDNR